LIGNAILFSCFVTVQKYLLRTVKPVTTTAWNVSVVAILFSFVSAFFIDTAHISEVQPEGWGSLAFAAILVMGLAYGILSWCSQHTSTTVITVYGTLLPVLSPIFGYFFLYETVTVVQVLGMVITISGVFLVIRARFVEEKLRLQTGANDVAKQNDEQMSTQLLEETDRKAHEEEGTVSRLIFENRDSGNTSLYDEEEALETPTQKSAGSRLSQEIELKEISGA